MASNINFLSNLFGRSAMLPTAMPLSEEEKRKLQGAPPLPAINAPAPPMPADPVNLPTIDDPALNGLPPTVTAEKLPLGTVADLSLPTIEPLPAPASTAAAQATPAAPAVPSLPAIDPTIEQSPRQQLEGRLGAIDAKDYSIKKDAAGNIIHRGKDRDKNWSTWDKIASALVGWAGGGLAGGIKAGTDRNFFEKMGDANQRERLLPAIEAARGSETQDMNQAVKAAQIDNIGRDNAYQDARLKEMTADRERKEGDRASRERTQRMNAVAGIFKNIPSFDPDAPEFAELKQALGDVNLPITKKDAKKNIKPVQDQRTGAWTVVLTDPLTGKTETRKVPDPDGKGQLTTTPTVIMQGELGLLRQNDAQDFQANEAQKKRQYDAAMEQSKMQAKLGFEQLATAQGRVKALQTERSKYIAAFQKANGTMPTEEQINEYLNAVAGQ